MDRRTPIRRLLAIVVIAGLALAPLSQPVMAAMSSDAPTMATMSASADKMASDMPCCAPKAPIPVGCDKCILMAACTDFTGLPAAVSGQAFAAVTPVMPSQSDFLPDGLRHRPPEHPPRTLV